VAGAAATVSNISATEPFGISGGSETLDAIFRSNAWRTPDALALVDPLDTLELIGRPPRRLTYKQANSAIGRLSAHLRELSLPRAARVALQLPNTVDAVISLLAVQRAGFTAVCLPLLWPAAEDVSALVDVAPKALICADVLVGNTRSSETALQIALATFSIRFVCGFGRDLPDGIIPLDGIFDTETTEPDLASSQEGFAEGAIITFAPGPSKTTAVTRSTNQLLVGGLAVVVETELPRHAVILGTMLSASFSVLTGTIVSWLMTGGTLVLHHPFDAGSLAEQISAAQPDMLVLPGRLIDDPATAELVHRCAAQRVLAIWRSPEQQASSATWKAKATLVDVLAFGEDGLIPLRRGRDGLPRAVPAGAIKAPTFAAKGTLVITTERTPAGTLALHGPMLPIQQPAPEPISSHHGVDTRYPCTFDAASNTLRLDGPPLADAPGQAARQAPAA
jgi:hypothetical protein